MELSKTIIQVITKQKLVHHGDMIVIGVSGGADSVALLHVLYLLRHPLGIKLHVAHMNHGLRAGAARDEKFVKALAFKLGLPISIHRQKRILSSQIVSEDTARQWRLKFFIKIARQVKAQAIALAHTQNDVAETVLMRLLRGTGLSGLRGMLSDHQMKGQKFIRPFLSIQRSQIERHLKFHHLAFCTDESNLQTHYLRNKIRLKLLPLLIKDYNENLPQVLIDLADCAQADYDYLLNQAKEVFEKNARVSKRKIVMKLKFLLKQHDSMRRMVLRLSFEHLISNLNHLSFKHIREVEDLLWIRPTGSVVHWPKAIQVLKAKNELIISF